MNNARVIYWAVLITLIIVLIKNGKPPALPGDLKGLTFKGVLKSYQTYAILDIVTKNKKVSQI
jgi:hypothetical protein